MEVDAIPPPRSALAASPAADENEPQTQAASHLALEDNMETEEPVGYQDIDWGDEAVSEGDPESEDERQHPPLTFERTPSPPTPRRTVLTAKEKEA